MQNAFSRVYHNKQHQPQQNHPLRPFEAYPIFMSQKEYI